MRHDKLCCCGWRQFLAVIYKRIAFLLDQSKEFFSGSGQLFDNILARFG